MKHKQAAEDELQQQEELLHREQQLAHEEAEQETEDEETSHSKEEKEGAERREEDSSVAEEILTSSQSTGVSKMQKIPLTNVSATDQIDPSLSISEDISEEYLATRTSKIASEYAQDTFESLDASTTFAHTAPPPSHPLTTSTPASDHTPRGRDIKQEPEEQENDEDREDSINAMSDGQSVRLGRERYKGRGN